MSAVTVIHGPHLDRLGDREQGHYGVLTLEQLNHRILEYAGNLNMDVHIFQSNAEHEIIQHIHTASAVSDGMVINPAGLGFSSLALRDAILLCRIPVIEVHLSNIHAREIFRRRTVISDVCAGQISGFKWAGYCAALHILKIALEKDPSIVS